MPSIRDLVVSLGLDFDGSGFDKADLRIASLKVGFGSIAGTIAGIGTALSAVTLSVAKSIDETYDQAAALGVSTEALQKLGYAAQLSGSSAEEVGAALGFLQRSSYAAANGSKEAAEIYNEFGVSLKDSNGNLRSSEALLLDFADGLKRIESPSERAAMLAKVLGRSAGPQLQQFLSQGSDAIRDLGKEFESLGGVFDGNTIDSARELNDTLDKMHAAIKAVGLQVAKAFMPTLKDATKLLDSFWTKNGAAVRSVIGSAVEGIGSAFAFVAKTVGFALDGLTMLFELFGPFKNAAIAVAGALLLIAAALLSPVVAIAVLAGAFLLLLDDINTFIEGGESILGDFVAWIEHLFDPVVDLFGELKTLFGFADVKSNFNVQATKGVVPSSEWRTGVVVPPLFDSPVSATSASASSLPGVSNSSNQSVSVAAPITINAAPGQSAQDIGKAVSDHLSRQLSSESAAARPASGVTYKGYR